MVFIPIRTTLGAVTRVTILKISAVGVTWVWLAVHITPYTIKKVTAMDVFAKVTDHHRFSSVVMLSQAVLDGHGL